MRALFLFVIGLFFGTGIGFLIGGGLGETAGHDHAGHDDSAHAAMAVTPWQGPSPGPVLSLTPDGGNAYNLKITADGFNFAPEAVNGPVETGTGHAHVYVNGVKILRAYSPYVHLPDMSSGDIVRVTLNTNDHSHWGIDNMPIAAEVVVP